MSRSGAERELAQQIAAHVGGVANIADVDNCVTRLRLVLHDPAQADKDALRMLPGVLSVVDRAGQLQVVIGDEAPAVHAAVLAMRSAEPGAGSGAGTAPPGAGDVPGARLAAPRATPGTNGARRRRFVDRAFDLLTGTFQPLLPALVGSGLVKTFLLVAVELGLVDTQSATYAVWAAAGNAAFYFLPVLVGITASRKLGADPFVGGVIGAALLEPSLTELDQAETVGSFLGLPLAVIDYSQAVVPPMIAAVMLAFTERSLKRRLPKSLHLILVPTLSLALLVPVTVIAFGPMGTYLGEAVSDAVGWIWDLSPAVAGALMGGFWQVFVIFGLHWAFVPVIVNDLSVQGYSLLTGPLVAAVLAQGAATLAVFFRTHNRNLRDVAGGASISAFVAGVTEPAIYGVTLPLRRPFLFACLGGAAGGAIAAAGGSAADSFILPGLITLPAYLSVGSFPLQLVGTAVAVGLAFGLTMAIGFADLPDAAAPAGPPTGTAPAGPAPSAAGASATQQLRPAATARGATGPGAAKPDLTTEHSARVEIAAPTAGRVVPLADVGDPVFAGELLGPGVALVPSEGLIRSPVSGTVTSLARSNHAVGVTSDENVEVLVHVGIETVHVAGKHCVGLVTRGQRVVRGEPLIDADLSALVAAGCDTTTPVVVTNAAVHTAVDPTNSRDVSAGEPVIRVRL